LDPDEARRSRTAGTTAAAGTYARARERHQKLESHLVFLLSSITGGGRYPRVVNQRRPR
jgi:hypothetical protein